MKKSILAIMSVSIVLIPALSLGTVMELVPQAEGFHPGQDHCSMQLAPGTTVPVNTQVTAVVVKIDPKITNIQFTWVDGDGVIVRNFLATSAPYVDMYTPNSVGSWMVSALCMEGIMIQQQLLVEFSVFVLPESPIGAIALMGSSVAAFGAYFLLRKPKTSL